MSCYHLESWPALEKQRTEYNGIEEDLGSGLMGYIVQPPKNNDNDNDKKNVIISFHDIYPYDFARNKSIADQFALAGFTVVHVNFVGDDPCTPGQVDVKQLENWVKKHTYENDIKHKLTNIVIPYIQKKIGGQIEKISVIGFCWGAYIALQACADPDIKDAIQAAVYFHPSFGLNAIIDENDPDCAKLAGQVDKTPTLIVAAGNDPTYVGPEGSVMKKLQKNSPDSMGYRLTDTKHGFVNHEDVNNPNVRDNVKQSIELAVTFLKDRLEN